MFRKVLTVNPAVMIPSDILMSIFVLFCVVAAIQLFFYLFFYSRFATYKPVEIKDIPNIPVSIVICARNEAANLEKNLPQVLEQDYPNFEVVVVNDCSEDETEDVLKRLCLKYPNLRTTFIRPDEKFTHGKKLALTVGIKSAKNECMLLTDADCFPESSQWLARMAYHFQPGTDIIFGYGGYIQYKGFVNKLIRFDTAIIAMQYLSYAMAGVPYMGVGRNLAYRKPIFFANKGFASHVDIKSGDDDLFINEVATKDAIAIEAGKPAFTRSEPRRTFGEWFEQKGRHLSTFVRYKAIHRNLLGLEVFSRVLFYLLVITLLIFKFWWVYVLSIFALRLTIQLLIFNSTMRRLNEKNLFLISPLLDLLIPFFNMGVYLSNAFRPKTKWR
jgi:poly-beta-1,6-N-acetyl-D-glucosamine synthase